MKFIFELRSPTTSLCYLDFYKIPFAKPPLGNLRFKKPVAPENWTGIRDASSQWRRNVNTFTQSTVNYFAFDRYRLNLKVKY